MIPKLNKASYVIRSLKLLSSFESLKVNRMFIGACIIVIVEELETNLMSLVIFITLNMCSTCFGH